MKFCPGSPLGLLRGLSAAWNPVSPEALREIWSRAAAHPDFPPSEIRVDPYGSVIRFADYGCRRSAYGWYIGPSPPPLWARSGRFCEHQRPVHLKNRKRHEDRWYPVILV